MDQLIDLMISALNDEWKAMAQYMVHASQMTGLYRDPIAEHMRGHAEDEQDHAERLTIHLFGKGLKFETVVPEFRVSLDPIEMITQDLEEEIKAIDKYSVILDIIGDNPDLTDTRVLIEDITTDEVEHQDENAALLRAKIGSRQQAIGVEAASRASNALIKVADQSDRISSAHFLNGEKLIRRADLFSMWAIDASRT